MNIPRAESLLNFNWHNRLPMILQAEAAECGLACLAMIAGYYGHDTDLTNLRSKFSISSNGTNLKHLMEMATRLHLAPRALRTEITQLNHVTLPCILHWNLNHFVVLKKIHNNNFYIHDPAFGERKIKIDELKKQFTGVALELTPTHEFSMKSDRKKLSFSDFWSRSLGLKRSITQVVLLSFLLQLFLLLSPLYMQTIVDDVLLREDRSLLTVLAIGFILLILIQTGTTALREFVILHLSNRLGIQISVNLFRHLIHLPIDYFSNRHMGDIVSRFGSLNQVRDMLTNGMVTAIVDGIMAIFTLTVMVIYNVKLTFIALGFIILYVLLRWLMYQPFRQLNEEAIAASAQENTHFMETMRAIQTIKLFHHEQDRQNQWQNRLANSINKKIQLSRWQIGYTTLNGLIFGVENIVIIYCAANAVMDNIMSLGMLYAFVSFKFRFITSSNNLITKWIEYKMLGLHFDRLADIAHTKEEKLGAGLDTENTIKGRIEARNISYRYSEHEPFIFKNVNLTIEPGETHLISGKSGSGKTTLLKCLMGLIDVSEGEIFIDDIPLKSVQNYRSYISSVMQDDQLLSGSITENITFFSSNVNMKRVIYCSKMAEIHNEIEEKIMRYETLVGDMGSNISGGQKQRILLARAFYKKPSILFLDEATCNLDQNNENLINSAIEGLPITKVMVTHSQKILTTNHKITTL